ncbi:MAG: alpha/beta hydrolase [Alphaproteobacteria bacterium]
MLASSGVAPGGVALTRDYLRVSDDLTIYYEEAGKGAPIVFIPGWTMTTWFFQHQLAHFAKSHRAITYDPRGQGRSSRTIENNHYTQHGRDLNDFLKALGLENVILAGWSWGCLDAYAYLRQFGTDNIKALIFIDQTPKALYGEEGDWWEGKPADWKAFVEGVNYDRRDFLDEFTKWMVIRELTAEELATIMDESLKAPTSTAIQLLADGVFADYSEEAKALDGKVPVMNVVREEWADMAKAWLAANAPHSAVYADAGHMMFWERPDAFNAALDDFLSALS